MNSFEEIREKIKQSPQSFSGYKELGEYYQEERHNVNQAYLCYEQAYALCEESESGLELQKLLENCRQDDQFCVNPVSFVILSYNAKDMMIDCLESIRKGCVPGSYEVVVVDNASEDGIRSYLVEQKDIILQLNEHNTSFAEGCNQGVRLAAPENDIMLLNNDTIVPAFAVFYLRLGLYEAENIGAAGALTNMIANYQRMPGDFASKEQWIENAKNIHLPSLFALESQAWLAGFALLIKRKAWELTGTLDERFVQGCYEDNDYGFRLNANGYRCVFCHNAFIFHYGSVSFKKNLAALNRIVKDNTERLNQKLGFRFLCYQSYQRELIDMMNPPDDAFSVLEIGSGFGLTLSAISYRYPNARVAGIETNPAVAKIGRGVAGVLCADIEKDELPFEKESFDYILCPKGINVFADALESVTRLKQLLKPTGKILVLQRNLMSAENVLAFLSGKFGTVVGKDEDAKHFYTKDELLSLLSEAGLSPVFIMKYTTGYMEDHPKEREVLEQIGRLPGVTVAEDFSVVSYIITCVKQ